MGSRIAAFTTYLVVSFHTDVVALQRYRVSRGSLRALRMSTSAFPASRSVPNPELVWNCVHIFRSEVAVVWNDEKSLAPVGSLIPFSAAAIAAVYAVAGSDSAVCM